MGKFITVVLLSILATNLWWVSFVFRCKDGTVSPAIIPAVILTIALGVIFVKEATENWN